MEAHDWWHLVVLGTTLFGAAGLAILALVPLVFEETPPGLARFRPLIWWLVGMATALLIGEWLGVH
jgi:hypothetical protein